MLHRFLKRVNHNKTVLALKLGSIWSGCLLFLLISGALFELMIPISITISTLTLKIILFFLILVATFITWNVYKAAKNSVQVIEYDIKGISQIFILSDYYTWLLPTFLLTFGLATTIILNLYDLLIPTLFSFSLFGLGLISFAWIIPSKRKNDLDLYMNLCISCMIFERYICNIEKLEPLGIRKFVEFFESSLYNIDKHLDKGIKINDLYVEDKELSFKNMILYLTPYIKYGSASELKLLHNNLNNIKKCVTETNELSTLKVTNYIVNIYKDEHEFLSTYNYQIRPEEPISELYRSLKKGTSTVILLSLGTIFIIYNQNSYTVNDVTVLLQSPSLKTLLEPISIILITFIGALGNLIVAMLSAVFSYYLGKNK